MTTSHHFPLAYVVCCCPLVTLALPSWSPAAEGPAVVSHVKVLSDKVEDVSSLEAWRRSFLRPGTTEWQKALAIWETVVKFRHTPVFFSMSASRPTTANHTAASRP
jgi:hypothetical protein